MHDGVVSILDLKVNGNIASFETDCFSSYALVYEDTLKTSNPITGDNIVIWIGLLIISFVGIVGTKRLKNKRISRH